MPQMIVIAGPPGSGKSTLFPVYEFGMDAFNADDRAAALHGSYREIPPEIRKAVNREFEAFIQEHIRVEKSFALETTLRSSITFEQAQMARDAGFTVSMKYVALESVELNIERVKLRADAGGHAASEQTLRATTAGNQRDG